MFFGFADENYFTNGYLDIVIDWILGMRGIHLKDLPSFIRIINPNNIFYKYLIEMANRAPMASGIVIHTFGSLEQEVLDALSTIFPHVYAIGPLQQLLNCLPNDPLKSIGYSLWEGKTKYLR